MENANAENYTHLFKIVLVGDTKTGKTNILSKYTSGKLPKNNLPTIGGEFATKTVKLNDGVTVKAQLWDTAGQERYRAITSAHYRRAVGAIVVYDITKEQTFNNARNWIEEVRRAAEPNTMILLIGAKLDLVEENPKSREVPTEVARTLAGIYDASFAETSVFAENGLNSVIDAFLTRLTENTGLNKDSKPIEKEGAKIPEIATTVQKDKTEKDNFNQNASVQSMKIVLVGDHDVGKTNVMCKYLKGTLPKNSIPTIGVEFSTKEVLLRSGATIKGQIWDTAGKERYRAITKTHFRRALGAIVFYDLTKAKTFENVMSWIEEVRSGEPDVVVMLVGNKLDLVEKDPSLRAVPRDAVEQMAKDNDLLYEEVSAVSGQNVNKIFGSLFEAISNKNNTGSTPLPQAKAI